MAQQYDNTNTGAIFKNDEKENGSKHPDYKGNLNVGGEDYWVSMWVKESGPNSQNPGKKFFSVSVTPKKQNQQAPARGKQQPKVEEDQGIPF